MRPRTAKTSTADFYCQSLHSFNLSYRYKLLEEYLGQCRSTILADKFTRTAFPFRVLLQTRLLPQKIPHNEQLHTLRSSSMIMGKNLIFRSTSLMRSRWQASRSMRYVLL